MKTNKIQHLKQKYEIGYFCKYRYFNSNLAYEKNIFAVYKTANLIDIYP